MPARLSRTLVRPTRVLAVLVAALAVVVGGLGLTPADAAAVPPASKAIRYALTQLGDPYVWGATGPNSFDCSGLTKAAYHYAGITLPRVAADQYRYGAKLPISQLQPGDLVFWATNIHNPATIHHVGIAVTKWHVLQAPHTGTVVQISPIWKSGLMPYVVRPGGVHAGKVLTPWPATVGDGIIDVQQRLRANGYHVAYTGWYDTNTRNAVKAFQRRYGVPYDNGTVQWRTWVALFGHGNSNTRL